MILTASIRTTNFKVVKQLYDSIMVRIIRCTITNRFEQLDLIEGGLCEVVSTFDHLKSYKPLCMQIPAEPNC